MWFGYAQEQLLGGRLDAMRRGMWDYAAANGFGDGQVFVELVPPERVLRSLLAQLDRDRPDLRVPQALSRVAAANGIVLDLVLASAAPRTHALWELMEILEGQGGGHVIVPAPHHLLSLGPSGRAVFERLTRMSSARIHYLGDQAPAKPTDSVEPATGAAEVEELTISEVQESPTLTRFDLLEALTKARLPEMIKPVDDLYVALVTDATAAMKQTPGSTANGSEHPMRIRLARRDATLTVELLERWQRSDRPTDVLRGLCAKVVRFTPPSGGTVTRCELPPDWSQPVLVAPSRIPDAQTPPLPEGSW
jgi:hypothetical protein